MDFREADYYRLRTEWLRYKGHLYDSLTGLPAFAAVVEDVRRLLEERRSVEVVYLDVGVFHSQGMWKNSVYSKCPWRGFASDIWVSIASSKHSVRIPLSSKTRMWW